MIINVYLQFFLFTLSLFSIWFISEKIVNAVVQISDLFNISAFFIGFVFIGIAAGIPELFIAITSALNSVPEIAVGDVLGANFNDLTLVIGGTALVGGLIKVKDDERKNLLFMLFLIAIAHVFIFYLGTISSIHGLFLIFLYFIGILFIWKRTVKEKKIQKFKNRPSFKKKIIACFKLVTAIALLLLFSQLSVNLAVDIAKNFKISLEVFGVTIFAIVTSLPELSLGLQSVRKEEYSLALGPILGSVLQQSCLSFGCLVLLSKQSVTILPLKTLFLFFALAMFVLVCSLVISKKIQRKYGIILFSLFLVSFFYHLFIH